MIPPILPEFLKRWRVTCPYCGDSYITKETAESIATHIDDPCHQCQAKGVDAVELKS